ncbi:bacillithiol biosynthesis cysteine-adding enzyme BshC [Ferruginibacter sp. HRS2-29]|uniref:bacillithiol biosynthesis cysteine-adding enzyme BshC n=1 Tax=Ferruginibacter sp. HRS2-29 TaxID=2487334 RepID=UPI0020CC503A|nr:bacillithiol biosynthesis cysteine-adding enzyme BshC [Ferruginibacter sp. HRS2-29]MCP9750036.1 bacillithiol biosynthesis cysteine-adding enzyme BshC [Ferruginibacter sp. HRS2-29]
MNFKAQQVGYKQTNSFSALVLDYISGATDLKDFYAYSPDLDGVKKAIEARRSFVTNRKVLVDQLNEQYNNSPVSDKLQANIDALLEENTFTITTAHQPNIFTGHLYFIYKIIHAIKMADQLSAKLPGNKFVPVYYMGSEDADLEELGEVVVKGKKYEWHTDQKGAVGRMVIDKAFMEIVQGIDGQLTVDPFGTEIMELVKDAYSLGKTIQQATFDFCNELFKDFGLIILIPDCSALKNEFKGIAVRELKEQFSSLAVKETIAAFPEKYKVQAAGRDINLFYLKENIRERIETVKDGYAVANTDIPFTEESLLNEINTNPERVSPNVILRPVFQELILPNIAFIGGGGELAYWLELKKVFEAAAVPFPVLVLRNSFSWINKKTDALINGLKLTAEDFFSNEQQLINTIVQRDAEVKLNMSEEKLSFIKLYKQVRSDATKVDSTLERHVWALQSHALQKLEQLEKKMLKAAKKQFDAQLRQVQKVKANLYPSGNLQERVDNMLPYYSNYGREFFNVLYEHSNTFEQTFCIITEQ